MSRRHCLPLLVAGCTACTSFSLNRAQANAAPPGAALTAPPPIAPAPTAPAPKAKLGSENDLFWGHHLSNRRVFLNGPINQASAEKIVAKLLYLDDLECKPIELIINSGGGEVYAGLAIYDMMNHIASPVHTVCIGHAESMAAIILSAGERGHRTAHPNVRIMVHQPRHALYGYHPTTDFVIEAWKNQEIHNRLAAIMVTTSGKTLEEVHASLDRNTYMTSEQGIAFGLIDSIIENKGRPTPTSTPNPTPTPTPPPPTPTTTP